MNFSLVALERIIDQFKENANLMMECLANMDRRGFMATLAAVDIIKKEAYDLGSGVNIPTTLYIFERTEVVTNAVLTGLIEGDSFVRFLSCISWEEGEKLLESCLKHPNCPEEIKEKAVHFTLARQKIEYFQSYGVKHEVVMEFSDTISSRIFEECQDPFIFQTIIDALTRDSRDPAKALCLHGLCNILLRDESRLSDEMKDFVGKNIEILEEMIDVAIGYDWCLEPSMRLVDLYDSGLTNAADISDTKISWEKNDTLAYYAMTRMGMMNSLKIDTEIEKKLNSSLFSKDLIPIMFLNSRYSVKQCSAALGLIEMDCFDEGEIFDQIADLINYEAKKESGHDFDIPLVRKKLAYAIINCELEPIDFPHTIIEKAGIKNLVIQDKRVKNIIFESELGL